MSQKKHLTKTYPAEFSAEIFGISRPRFVGTEWILGEEKVDELERPRLEHRDSTHFDPAVLEEELSQHEAPKILRTHGTFRQQHWRTVSDVMKSGVPDEVKEAVRMLNLGGDRTIYLVRAEQLKKDVELLRSLSIASGAVRSKEWREAKAAIERGTELLRAVMADALPRKDSQVTKRSADPLNLPEPELSPELEDLLRKHHPEYFEGSSLRQVRPSNKTGPREIKRDSRSSFVFGVLAGARRSRCRTFLHGRNATA